MTSTLARIACAACFATLALPADAARQDYYRYPIQRLSVGFDASGATVRTPGISNDGRFVLFNVTQSGSFAYVLDRQLGTTVPVAPDCVNAVTVPCHVHSARLSGNGNVVVFSSSREYPPAPAAGPQVFSWNRTTGAVQRVSVGIGGANPAGPPGFNASSTPTDVSRDGRYVVFMSTAINLVTTPDLGQTVTPLQRAFWRDVQNGETRLVNHGAYLYQEYDGARMSANGRHVVVRKQGPFHSLYRWDSVLGQFDVASDSSNYNNSTLAEFGISPEGGLAYNAHGDRGTLRIHRPGPTAAVALRSVNVGRYIGSVDVSSGAFHTAMHRCPPNENANFLSYNSQLVLTTASDEAHFYLEHSQYPFGEASCNQGLDMTPDGRYVVFGDGNLLHASPPAPHFSQHVYLLENPLWRAPPENLAANAQGIPANSRHVKVSIDGKLATFESEVPASAFDAGFVDNNNAPDIFRYVPQFDSVELVSTDDGVNALPQGARNPAMSQDGRVVAFEAVDAGITAQNLLAAGWSGELRTSPKAATSTAVFVRNVVQGGLQRVSTSRTGSAANGSSMHAAVSSDGRRIVFSTDASNVVPDTDPNAVRDLVQVELGSGVRRCVSTCGGVSPEAPSDFGTISNDGDVAFQSASTVLQKHAAATKASTALQVFLRTLVSGALQRLSRTTAGASGNGDSLRPSISDNGDVVVYQSGATNLDGAADGRVHVQRHDVRSGQNKRLSLRSAPVGAVAGKAIALDGDSSRPTVSGDGRFVVFQSAAGNLADYDTNGATDLFVHDARSDRLQRVAQGFDGAESNGHSEVPHLNFNGTAIGFHSFASNLDEEGSGTPNATSAPYRTGNPLGSQIVFADGFD